MYSQHNNKKIKKKLELFFRHMPEKVDPLGPGISGAAVSLMVLSPGTFPIHLPSLQALSTLLVRILDTFLLLQHRTEVSLGLWNLREAC
jgi:hypothetical protein